MSARGLLHPRSFAQLPGRVRAAQHPRAAAPATFTRDQLQRTLSAPLPIAPTLAPAEANIKRARRAWRDDAAALEHGQAQLHGEARGRGAAALARRAVKARHANLAKMFLLCDERGDGRVACVQFKRIVAQQVRGVSPVDIKLSCRLFGEREFSHARRPGRARQLPQVPAPL